MNWSSDYRTRRLRKAAQIFDAIFSMSVLIIFGFFIGYALVHGDPPAWVLHLLGR